MNLYLITRNDDANYEEYRGFLVRSATDRNAIKMCEDCAKPWHSNETYFTDITIERLATNVEGKEEIVMSDFNAG